MPEYYSNVAIPCSMFLWVGPSLNWAATRNEECDKSKWVRWYWPTLNSFDFNRNCLHSNWIDGWRTLSISIDPYNINERLWLNQWWYQSENGILHLFIFLKVIHQRFSNIHSPFMHKLSAPHTDYKRHNRIIVDFVLIATGEKKGTTPIGISWSGRYKSISILNSVCVHIESIYHIVDGRCDMKHRV